MKSDIDDLNLGTLDTWAKYDEYFNLLTKVLGMLVQSLQREADSENYEARSIQSFGKKFLATVQALRHRYSYLSEHERSLWIDLSESGFPHQQELVNMQTDFFMKDEKLANILPESLLKRRILDHLLLTGQEPTELLRDLALRVYYDSLNENQFYPYSPGELVSQKKAKGEPRKYTYTWGCYDFMTNQPYVHVMSFHQDLEAAPLGEYGESREEFLRVIEQEGSRVPSMSVLGTGIDTAISSIHPKAIKRTGIGPLYSPSLLKGRQAASEREANLCMVLEKCGCAEDDFVLFYTEELLFSVRQERTRSLLKPLGHMKEIFHIPSATDQSAFSRRTSMVTTTVLMPHLMRQSLVPSDLMALGLSGARILTYDEGGTVHGS